ncbi:hypothetical protein M501DRAFT_995619 [Patellaria atrata CBS 101060]|uniref:C2H2-type domain-containing protein n=1 Tax=Patellaria atrata CBS 101060 TaxID=1346257 RepID=A0A9P4VQB6_9PEZI|nr:hypothetical protein M501DRAFT_995619 [Patellaria atrata CBS 101060]
MEANYDLMNIGDAHEINHGRFETHDVPGEFSPIEPFDSSLDDILATTSQQLAQIDNFWPCSVQGPWNQLAAYQFQNQYGYPSSDEVYGPIDGSGIGQHETLPTSDTGFSSQPLVPNILETDQGEVIEGFPAVPFEQEEDLFIWSKQGIQVEEAVSESTLRTIHSDADNSHNPNSSVPNSVSSSTPSRRTNGTHPCRRPRIDPSAKDFLDRWFWDNKHWPYLNNGSLVSLIAKTSLSKATINNYLVKLRTQNIVPENLDPDLQTNQPLWSMKGGMQPRPGPMRRRGKSRYRTEIATASPTDDPVTLFSSETRSEEIFYSCTFCEKGKEIKQKSEWKRHELTHVPYGKHWTCMLYNSPLVGNRCVFCGIEDPDESHLQKHNIKACEDKAPHDRTFRRRDHFWQHYINVHFKEIEVAGPFIECKGRKFLDTWKTDSSPSEVKQRDLWCGFCKFSLATWPERCEHIAEHFEGGKRMSDWTSFRASLEG